MQTNNKLRSRILSLAMAAAMVTSVLSTAVFAEEDTSAAGTVGTVQSFDKLPDRFIPSADENAPGNSYTLAVGLHTPAEDLQLPAALDAMVERTADAVQDSGTAAAKESVWVTWQSDKEYKADEGGTFVYTAVLPEGYALARGAKLPQIHVAVGMQARDARAGSITVGGDNPTPGYELSNLSTLLKAINAIPEGGTVKIGADINLGAIGVSINRTLTLDLNGKTISFNGDNYTYAMSLNGGTMTITDSGSNGKISANNLGGTVIGIAAGTLTVSDGILETTGGDAETIINNDGIINVSGGTVLASGEAGSAIVNNKSSKISISGTANVTSANSSATEGTITFAAVPYPAAPILEIKDNAVVENTTATGFAVYFKPEAVTSANLSGYYTHTGGTVGKVKPAAGGGGGGGGGGGSSSGGDGEKKDPLLHKGDTGSTGSTKSPSASKNNVIDTTAGNKGATDVVANAIQNAVSQSGAVAKATFSNFAALDVAGLNAINSIAAKESAGKTVDFKVNFDTVAQGAVTSRVSVDPAALAKVLTEQLPLGVYFNQQKDKQVTNVNKMFDKFFANQVVTVSYDQKSPLAVNAELAAKLDLSGLNEKALYIYSYNRETSAYTRIDKPNFRVDENGYSHFTAPLGGSIIITDSPLTRK